MRDLNLASIIDETANMTCDGFIEVLDKAASLFSQESGRKGNLTITGHLVELEPVGEALIIGDLHGDQESLLTILQNSNFIDKMTQTQNAIMIFLGDYGDRGIKSVETYYSILKLKLVFPQQVVFLRGNHEAPQELLADPHDLPYEFRRLFGEDWQLAYYKTRALWSHFYNAVYVPERYLMLHGGLSPQLGSLIDIAIADENHGMDLLEDLLWSDPDENVQGIASSPRGAGKLFGKTITQIVLKKLNAQILIRGHEATELGFKINHDDKVLTLFSRKGPPYNNPCGAYLQIPLKEKPQNARKIVEMIHKF